MIDVTDDFSFSKDAFRIQPTYKPYIDSIILPDGIIMNRWVRIAERVLKDFDGEEELHILTIMSGGFRFFEDLKRCLDA